MENINKIFLVMLLVVVTILSACYLTTAQELSSTESSPFPLTPALAAKQLQSVSGSETCSLPETPSAIERMFRQLVKEDVEHEFTCDNTVLGEFRYCPAPNCHHIFNASQIFRFPGYYWITADNGSTIQVYCDFESEQVSHTSAEIEDIADNICPTTEQIYFAQQSIQFYDQLSQISPSILPCTSQIIGLVAHCPVNNCSQVFVLVHEDFLRLSNYYWLQAPDGDVTEVYYNSSTMQSEYSSCQKLFMFEEVPSGTYTFRLPDGTHSDVYCNYETGQGEHESCAHANLFGLPSGTYTIRPSGGSPMTVYCDMDNEECGGGVWTRVASYNYSNPNTACPDNWNLIPSTIRACGRSLFGAGCSSAIFPTNNIEFSSVCGRVIAIQFFSTHAFYSYHGQSQSSINDYYVDGVSITYGVPRQHVWTFAAYSSDDSTSRNELCPCSQPSLSIPSPPSFVGNNYFCDTGTSTCCHVAYYYNDPLWDGQGCGGPSTCCSFNNPPWFSTALPDTTSDDIEVRFCDNQGTGDTPVTLLDLYIQ